MRPRVTRQTIRWPIVLLLTVALVLAGLEVAEREHSEDAVAGKEEPAVVAPIEGTGLKQVKISPAAARRLSLQTAPSRLIGGRSVVPYSALLYDEHGKTWVYTSVAHLTFRRALVRNVSVRNGSATVTGRLQPGTRVVTVGAAELYGAELGVDH